MKKQIEKFKMTSVVERNVNHSKDFQTISMLVKIKSLDVVSTDSENMSGIVNAGQRS